MSVTMHPMVLPHMVISPRQPHADLFLSMEAERLELSCAWQPPSHALALHPRPARCQLQLLVELSALRGGCAQAGVVTAHLTVRGRYGAGGATAVARPPVRRVLQRFVGLTGLHTLALRRWWQACRSPAGLVRPSKTST
jgi:hypothetical protein